MEFTDAVFHLITLLATYWVCVCVWGGSEGVRGRGRVSECRKQGWMRQMGPKQTHTVTWLLAVVEGNQRLSDLPASLQSPVPVWPFLTDFSGQTALREA